MIYFFFFLFKAVLHGERDAAYFAAKLTEEESMFEFAAKLGHAKAAATLARDFLSVDSVQYWRMLCLALRKDQKNHRSEFVDSFPSQVPLFGGNPEIVFAIGEALADGHVVGHAIFGIFDKATKVEAGKRAIEFYQTQCKAARLAIDTWTLFAMRLGIVKDIRRMISSIVWEDKKLCPYQSMILTSVQECSFGVGEEKKKEGEVAPAIETLVPPGDGWNRIPRVEKVEKKPTRNLKRK